MELPNKKNISHRGERSAYWNSTKIIVGHKSYSALRFRFFGYVSSMSLSYPANMKKATRQQLWSKYHFNLNNWLKTISSRVYIFFVSMVHQILPPPTTKCRKAPPEIHMKFFISGFFFIANSWKLKEGRWYAFPSHTWTLFSAVVCFRDMTLYFYNIVKIFLFYYVHFILAQCDGV